MASALQPPFSKAAAKLATTPKHPRRFFGCAYLILGSVMLGSRVVESAWQYHATLATYIGFGEGIVFVALGVLYFVKAWRSEARSKANVSRA